MHKKSEAKKFKKWWEKQGIDDTRTAEQGWMARAKLAHKENCRLLDTVQEAMECIVSITDEVIDAPGIEFESGCPEGVLITYDQVDALCRAIMDIALAHDMVDIGENDAVEENQQQSGFTTEYKN